MYGIQLIVCYLVFIEISQGFSRDELVICDQCTFYASKLRPIELFFCRVDKGDQFFGIGFIVQCTVKHSVLVIAIC